MAQVELMCGNTKSIPLGPLEAVSLEQLLEAAQEHYGSSKGLPATLTPQRSGNPSDFGESVEKIEEARTTPRPSAPQTGSRRSSKTSPRSRNTRRNPDSAQETQQERPPTPPMPPSRERPPSISPRKVSLTNGGGVSPSKLKFYWVDEDGTTKHFIDTAADLELIRTVARENGVATPPEGTQPEGETFLTRPPPTVRLYAKHASSSSSTSPIMSMTSLLAPPSSSNAAVAAPEEDDKETLSVDGVSPNAANKNSVSPMTDVEVSSSSQTASAVASPQSQQESSMAALMDTGLENTFRAHEVGQKNEELDVEEHDEDESPSPVRLDSSPQVTREGSKSHQQPPSHSDSIRTATADEMTPRTSSPPPASGIQTLNGSLLSHSEKEDDSNAQSTSGRMSREASSKYPMDSRQGTYYSTTSNGSNSAIRAANSKERHDRGEKSKNRRYKREKLIGRGADGKVYLAHDQKLDVKVAIKDILIAPADAKSGESSEEAKMTLIKKQIELLQKLPSHTNVVQHKGVERATCSMSIVMEYIAGGSITAALNKLGAFSESVVRTYARDLCKGLAFLHKSGIIHRDIKGANCLIGIDGSVKVADFGSCIIHSMVDHQKQKSGIIGTSMWMSPECIQSQPATDKSDIWSLGCTIVEMASGKPPWHEARFTNEWAAMFYISQSQRGPPVPTSLSRQAHAFLQKCFSIDPENRMSAEECLEHPFLSMDFDADSDDREMMPPSPSELQPPHKFPNAKGTPATASLTSSITTDNEYATSNFSSFAVYDAEWGDREAVDDLVEDPKDPMFPNGKRNPAAVEALPAFNSRSYASMDARASAEPEKDEAALSRKSGTQSPAPGHRGTVSHEAIVSFIAATAQTTEKPAAQSEEAEVAPDDDEMDFGLPEAVLFNVFHYLDAAGLCAVAGTNQRLQAMVNFGAKEVLWKNLFVKIFGEVDNVRMALRKNWREYYKNSVIHSNLLHGDRYLVKRQLCQSQRVYEAIDTQTNEEVVIKFEPWQLGPARAKRGAGGLPPADLRSQGGNSSSDFGPSYDVTGRSLTSSQSSRTPTKRLPSTPTKNTVSGQSSQHSTPGSANTSVSLSPMKSGGEFGPIVGRPPLRSGMSNRTPQLSTSAMGLTASSGSVVSASSTSVSPSVNGATATTPQTPSSRENTNGSNSPTPHAQHHLPSLPQPPTLPAMNPGPSIHNLPPNISRGRLLPRSKQRMPNPSVPVNIPHALSPFAQRRAPSPSNSQPGLDGTLGSARPDSSHTNQLTSRQGSWGDLYEYQRISDQQREAQSSSLTPIKPLRSALQHQYKTIRHLEAMGCQNVPRVVSFSDTEAEYQNILVTSKLGPSLNELLLFCGNQLSLRTVTQLTLRLVRALETMHEHDVVHGCITPTNIVVGDGADSSNLYMINFSQSRYFRDPRTHRPTTTSTVGSNTSKAKNQEFLTFCSTFVQRGCTPAPRDDIIALGYVLCYLVHGGLPWIHEGKLTASEVVQRKNSYLEQLLRTPPIQLHYFLKSGYALKQGEVPDFPYLTSLVSRMMRERGWNEDGEFDWSEQLR